MNGANMVLNGPNSNILGVAPKTKPSKAQAGRLPNRSTEQWRVVGRRRWKNLKDAINPYFHEQAKNFAENGVQPYKTDKELTLASTLFLIEDLKYGRKGLSLPVPRTNCDLSPLQRKSTTDMARKNERVLFWRIFDELDEEHRDYIWDVKGDSEFRITYAAHLYIHNVAFTDLDGYPVYARLPKDYLDEDHDDYADAEAVDGNGSERLVQGLPTEVHDDYLYNA